MSLINQLKLYIIWLIISPWLGAFFVEDVLPSNGFYRLAQGISILTWVVLAIAGMLYFISRYHDIKKR